MIGKSSLVCLAVLLAGCASLHQPSLTGPSALKQRQQRNAAVARQFEQSRETAEYRMALHHYEEDQFPQCRQVLQQILERNPQHREARLLLAEAYLAEHDLENGRKQVEQALNNHPDDAHALYTMGVLLDALGRAADAATYYGRAAQLEPNSEIYTVSYQTAMKTAAAPSDSPAGEPGGVQLASHAEKVASGGPTGSVGVAGDAERDKLRLLFTQAEKALAEGSIPAAQASFEEAVALRPRDPQVRLSVAVASLRHNQPDLAIHVLTEGTKLFPDCAAMHRTLGAAYYRQSNYAASQSALQQALSLDKSSALSYFLLGCTLAKLGQSDAAAAQFRQAQALDPRYTLQR